jgi:hypothetical protein
MKSGVILLLAVVHICLGAAAVYQYSNADSTFITTNIAKYAGMDREALEK